jgi:pyruvate dehydrogenase E1 component alpha subunit
MVRWPGTRVLWPELVTGETDIGMAWDPSRVPEQHRAWFTDHDPILRFARELLQAGAASPTALREVDQRVRAEIEEAIAFAANSPFPSPESALERVFARSRQA